MKTPSKEFSNIFHSIILGVFLFFNFAVAYLIITSCYNLQNLNSQITIIFCIAGLILTWGFYGFFKIISNAKQNKYLVETMLNFITNPEQINSDKMQKILNEIVNKEIRALDDSIDNINQTLEGHYEKSLKIEEKLKNQNEKLTTLLNTVSDNLEKTTSKCFDNINTFQNLVNSEQIKNLVLKTNDFSKNVNELYSNSENISKELTLLNTKMISEIKEIIQTSDTLNQNLNKVFEDSSNKFNSFTIDIDSLKQKLSSSMQETVSEFNNIQNEADKFNTLLIENKDNLQMSQESLKTYTSQTITMLQSQVREINYTVQNVGGQIRLAESSLETQENGLKQALINLMEYAKNMEEYVKGVSKEITSLTVKMQNQLKDFSGEVVKSMQEVNLSATTTLSETDNATKAFSLSVQDMSSSIQSSLSEVSKLHEKLTTDTINLMKLSKETTAQLSPMSGIMTSYNQLLPQITNNTKNFLDTFSNQISSFEKQSNEATTLLSTKLAELDIQINTIKNSASVSTNDLKILIDNLNNASKQSITNVENSLKDYKSVLNQIEQTNNNLNFAMIKQNLITKENENQQHIQTSINNPQKIDLIADKLHEISMELSQLSGINIPNIVWQRYNTGETSIFSDWLSQILDKFDKGKLKAIIKSDDKFRQKSLNFIKGFERILDIINIMDNSNIMTQTTMSTSLGKIYYSLKQYL